MARFSRKQLKEDRFAQEVGQGVEYVTSHRKYFVVGGIAAVLAIVGTLSYIGYQKEQKAEARHSLQQAMNLFYGKVEADPGSGVVSFATNIERNDRTTEALTNVAENFPDRPEGAAARYYLALLEIEQKNEEKAREILESVVARPDREMAALARLALGDLLRKQEKDQEARQHYEYLVDHPTRLVPKQRAQLALADLLADTSPEEAKSLLEELLKEPAGISTRAANIMSRMQRKSPS